MGAGILAPGLQQLVQVLAEEDLCDIYVSAPDGERSAQSCALTLGRSLTATAVQVAGAIAAYAIDGTPADSAMLALSCPALFGHQVRFDAIVSGINRGDNAGMHVGYSGTIGAAREASLRGVPAFALSLDNFRGPPEYGHAARLLLPLLKGVLGYLPDAGEGNERHNNNEATAVLQRRQEIRHVLEGSIINLNFPMLEEKDTLGYFITTQGLSSIQMTFAEDHLGHPSLPPERLEDDVDGYQGGNSRPAVHASSTADNGVNAVAGGNVSSGKKDIDTNNNHAGGGGGGGRRVFKKQFGTYVRDDTIGSDLWAVDHGWVSVNLFGLQSDLLGVSHYPDYAKTSQGDVYNPAGSSSLESSLGSPGKGSSPFEATGGPLPLTWANDPAKRAEGRYGECKLVQLGKLVQMAAESTGKQCRSWGDFFR